MNGLVFVAAADPNKRLSGGFGLLVVLLLAVVVVFLFRSMNHHLRKVRQINFDDDKAPTAPTSSPDPASRPTTRAQDSSAPSLTKPAKPNTK